MPPQGRRPGLKGPVPSRAPLDLTSALNASAMPLELEGWTAPGAEVDRLMLASCVDPTLEVRDGSDRLTVRDRQPVELAGRELEMWLRKTHPGTGYTREEPRERVLGRSFRERSTATVHVRRLPERVEPGQSRPKRLRTVWSVAHRRDMAP